MKKQLLILTLAVFLLPATLMAMKEMDHGGMSMGGSMIMLQDVEVDDVMASGHLLDVKEKMAQHGMPHTHHFMVELMNTQGNGIAEGTVAVKIQSPDGSVSQPIRLMAMSGAFGADIVLNKKGKYVFTVGSKLADGKKRTFMMHFENK